MKKMKNGRLIHAAREAYMHKKAIGAVGSTTAWLADTCLPGDFSASVKNSKNVVSENGVFFVQDLGTGAEFIKSFLDGVAKHRVWEREVDHIAA